MAESTVTLSELLRAYERSLVAKAQLVEFAAWGGGMTAAFKAQVAEHASMEQEYLQRLIEHRRREGSGALPK